MKQGQESDVRNGGTPSVVSRQASPGRRIAHGITAAVGWLLFAYWWWIVFGRVSRDEILFTIFIISATALVTILLTALWSLHNSRLHRRRAPRTQVQPAKDAYPRDTLLRTVAFAGGKERIRREAQVFVQVGENSKDYRFDVPLPRVAPDKPAKPTSPRGTDRA